MKYKYYPKTTEELIEAIEKEVYDVQGTLDNPNWKADLNCIDTSRIRDMSWLFGSDSLSYHSNPLSKFNGDISGWNVSNVENMTGIFAESSFKGDISKWDVSNVKSFNRAFQEADFNGDISKWDVSGAEDMAWMFAESGFNGNIGHWNVSNVKNMTHMFIGAKFNGDIGNWDSASEGTPFLSNASFIAAEMLNGRIPDSKRVDACKRIPDKIVSLNTLYTIFEKKRFLSFGYNKDEVGYKVTEALDFNSFEKNDFVLLYLITKERCLRTFFTEKDIREFSSILKEKVSVKDFNRFYIKTEKINKISNPEIKIRNLLVFLQREKNPVMKRLAYGAVIKEKMKEKEITPDSPSL
jgi:hypothetical protein